MSDDNESGPTPEQWAEIERKLGRDPLPDVMRRLDVIEWVTYDLLIELQARWPFSPGHAIEQPYHPRPPDEVVNAARRALKGGRE